MLISTHLLIRKEGILQPLPGCYETTVLPELVKQAHPFFQTNQLAHHHLAHQSFLLH